MDAYTGRRLLKDLKDQLEISGLMDDEVTFHDLVDILAILGFDAASDIYMRILEKGTQGNE